MFKKFGKYYYSYDGIYRTKSEVNKAKSKWKKRSKKTGMDFKTKIVESKAKYKGKMKIEPTTYSIYVLSGEVYPRLKNKQGWQRK